MRIVATLFLTLGLHQTHFKLQKHHNNINSVLALTKYINLVISDPSKPIIIISNVCLYKKKYFITHMNSYVSFVYL